MTVLLAILFGTLIGLLLGLVGGGGSILTVPILVYVIGQDVHAATATSLVIVGLTALSGAVPHAQGRPRGTADSGRLRRRRRHRRLRRRMAERAPRGTVDPLPLWRPDAGRRGANGFWADAARIGDTAGIEGRAPPPPCWSLDSSSAR